MGAPGGIAGICVSGGTEGFRTARRGEKGGRFSRLPEEELKEVLRREKGTGRFVGQCGGEAYKRGEASIRISRAGGKFVVGRITEGTPRGEKQHTYTSPYKET